MRLLFIAVIAAAPACASAQANPDSVHHRNDCRLAAQVLRTGEPNTKTAWAWATAQGCQRIGSSAAAALQRLRASDDTAALGSLVTISRRLSDDDLFGAAVEVASDGDASPAARVAALAALLYQVTEHTAAEYPGLLTVPAAGHWCQLEYYPRTVVVLQGKALRSGAADLAVSSASAIEGSSAPAVVKSAADCLERAVRLER